MKPPTRSQFTDHRSHNPGRAPRAANRPNSGVPHRIVFDITSRCNLRCRHCPIEASPEAPVDGDLPHDRIRSLLLELSLAGVQEIMISGGEPLCHPAFTAILRETEASGPRVILRTNAMLITREVAAQLAGFGITRIRVAFDGAEQIHDAIRGRGAYQKALAGTRNLVNCCTDPIAELMIHTHTLEKIDDFFEDMATTGVRTIRITPVQPIGRAAHLANRDLLGFIPNRTAMERLLELGLTYDITIHISPEEFPAVREIPGFGPKAETTGTCRAGFDHGYISPSGEVYPCISIPGIPFGSITQRPFREVWQGDEARRFRQKALSSEDYKLCEATCFHLSEPQQASAPSGSRMRILTREPGF
jgi:radical SAM protein with 4Fe4S-binding SPASM domain